MRSSQTRIPRTVVAGTLFAVSVSAVHAQDKLRQLLQDHAPSSRWIYDSWKTAQQVAGKNKKPLFVVFRCVP